MGSLPAQREDSSLPVFSEITQGVTKTMEGPLTYDSGEGWKGLRKGRKAWGQPEAGDKTVSLGRDKEQEESILASILVSGLDRYKGQSSCKLRKMGPSAKFMGTEYRCEPFVGKDLSARETSTLYFCGRA